MVELGSSDIGGMIKIDRCLNDLGNRLENLINKLDDMKARKSFMEKELSKETDYMDDIERCRKIIAEIDLQLGIDEE